MSARHLKIENEDQLLVHIEREKDFSIKYRLVFLNALKALSYDLNKACEVFSVAIPTAYVWIRQWNENGYEGIAHPFHQSDKPRGRPPKLTDDDLKKLKDLLSKKPNWLTKEVAELIFKTWGVKLSFAQVARILKKKLKMHFSKPYPHDYRRPPDAEEKLMQALEDSYKDLKEKGILRENVAIGFVDEASPQTTANTVRVWHFGHGDIIKDTSKYKSNAIGFYALQGNSVLDFLANSKKETMAVFLSKIKKANDKSKAIIVILDNFTSHDSGVFRKTAEDLGIVLIFLPSYSPDLNPIEQIWKSVKREVSINFIFSSAYLKHIISDTWNELSQSLRYAKGWAEQFTPWIVIAN
jgi:transposase